MPRSTRGKWSIQDRQRRLLLFLLLVRLQRRRVLVEPLDLFEQGLDHLGFLDVPDRHAPLEDDPLAAAGGDAEVGLLGLAEAVDQAAEDADPQRVG